MLSRKVQKYGLKNFQVFLEQNNSRGPKVLTKKEFIHKLKNVDIAIRNKDLISLFNYLDSAKSGEAIKVADLIQLIDFAIQNNQESNERVQQVVQMKALIQ